LARLGERVAGLEADPAARQPRPLAPIVTAESWDGGASTCNSFLYRFDRVSVAAAPGGGWHRLVGGDTIKSSSSRLVRRAAPGSFVSAQGPAALRTLATLSR
jgi:hypothetical protein